MHDETSYPNAYHFDGLRFVPTKKDTTMRGTRLTDISEKFPVWGFGSLACPGRFHASLVMKMVLVHLISNYDIRFEDPKARRQFRWETFTMPYESTRILIRPRAC
jgi:cytochrome P450